MATLTVLGSNSSGNGYILQAGKESLILEAGVPVKEALKALDYDVKNVKAVIATHEHGDHLGYCQQYQRYFKVSSTPSAADKHFGVMPLRNLARYIFGRFTVTPLIVPHSCDCFAYHISHPDMGTLVFYTDCSDFPYKIPHINFILGEVNNSDNVILDNLCNGYELRSQYNNHMSLDTAVGVIRRLYSPELSKVICCHLSDSNADESEIKRRFKSELGIEVCIAEKYSRFILQNQDF